MRFASDVLLEIVNIVREGLAESKDISQMLRELDVDLDSSTQTIALSSDYRKQKGL